MHSDETLPAQSETVIVIPPDLGPRKAAGFTMTEMLIVIVIIAILALVAFTMTSRMRAAADNAKCVTNLRELGVMAQLYASDHDGTILPPMFNPPLIFWDTALAEYVDGKDGCEIWKCPGDRIPRTKGKKWPGDATRIAPPRSYMANGFIFNLWGQHPAYTGHPANTPAKLSRIQNPTQPAWNPSKMWLLTELHQMQGDGDLVMGEHGGSMMGGPRPTPTHGTNVNALMLDCHVENRPPVSDKWWGLGK